MNDAPAPRTVAWPALTLAAALGCWLFTLARAAGHALPDLRAQETVAVLAFAIALGKVALALRYGGGSHAAARASALAAIALPIVSAAWLALLPSVRATASNVACAALLGVPLAAASYAAAAELSTAPRRAGATAAWLAAMGVGASGALLTFPAIGAEGALAAACLLAAVAALGYARGTALRAVAAAALIAAAGSSAARETLLTVPNQTAIPAEVRKLQADAAALGLTVAPRLDRWDASARIQSFELLERGRPTGLGVLLRDSAWVAPLVRAAGPRPQLVAELCEHTLQAVPFRTRRTRVLLAGIGGGLELQCATHHGAARIDVAEPSDAQREAVRTWLQSDPGAGRTRVRHVRAAARSWRERSAQRYDLVILPNARTKHTLPAGVLPIPQALNETDRGLRALLSLLDPDGMLWATTRSEPAALRLASTAHKALQANGIAAPSSHIVVHRAGDSYGVAVTRAPLSLNQVIDLHTRAKERGRTVESPALQRLFDWPLAAPELIFTPGAAFVNRFGNLFARTGRRPANALQRAYAFDIAPATDDRPLFHERTRRDRPETWFAASPLRVLPKLAAVALLCALGLIAVLAVRLRPPTALRSAIALGALGAGQTLFYAFWLHALALWTERPEHAFALMALSLPVLVLMRLPWRVALRALPWALAVHALAAAAAVPLAPLLVLLLGHSAVAVATVLLFALAAALSWHPPRPDLGPVPEAEVVATPGEP